MTVLAGSPEVLDRLLSHVDATGDCWEFRGAKTGGYGAFAVAGVTWRAHRLVYEALVGPIPAGLTLDHLCRNRVCVNPDHMEIVTARTNTLRGFGFAALNARKTACPRGHEYSGVRPTGGRVCQTCVNEAVRRWRSRRDAL